MRLKLAILLPTLAIMAALFVLGVTRPELMQPLTIGIPLVAFVGMGILFFMEQSRKRRTNRTGGEVTQEAPQGNGGRKKIRLGVLIAAAILMAVLYIFMLLQPDLLLPLGIAFAVVVVAALVTTFMIDSASKRSVRSGD